MSTLALSSVTATSVRVPLDDSRERLERVGRRAPAGVDAGVVTPSVQAMVARLLQEAGMVATVAARLSAQVAETAADLAATDGAQAQCYASGPTR